MSDAPSRNLLRASTVRWERTHIDGCAVSLVGGECDCPPARRIVYLDDVLNALEEGFNPQSNPPSRALPEHPADYISRRFADA